MEFYGTLVVWALSRSRVNFSISSPGPSPRSKWRSEKPQAKAAKRVVRILSREHDETSSLPLKKTNRAARRWKQPLKKSFHRVSRDKILHDSWSILAALARGFSDRHFERGEGPGDEVVNFCTLAYSPEFRKLQMAKPRINLIFAM